MTNVTCYHCPNCGAWVLPGNIGWINNEHCPYCGFQMEKVSK